MEKIAEAVTIQDGVMHEGQESYRIATPTATYYYHKQGAGFASLVDQDGNDWISYHPFGGSDGKYRGVPNLVHPEGYFHPGNPNCTSNVVEQNGDKVVLHSESKDGKWACQWEIFRDCARLTVLKIDHAYWFLYEGTPGGQLDEEKDLCVLSNGQCKPASERWDIKLSQPRWICFRAGNVGRMLFLYHDYDDGEIDSYWPMEGNMTVFGFGRQKLDKFLQKCPGTFTIGLINETDYEQAKEKIKQVVSRFADYR